MHSISNIPIDFLLFLFFSSYAIVSGKSVHQRLEITRGWSAPDCWYSQTYLVNGQLPGPPIYAEVGDLLELTVINRLNVSFGMHWHGILHPNTPGMDGTPGVTENAINPGQQRTYKFPVSHPGTFFYHAHTRFHAVSAHGALIVTSRREQQQLKYDREQELVLSEYFHQDVDHLLDEHEHFRANTTMAAANAILVNGRAPAPLNNTVSCINTRSRACKRGICSAYELTVRRNEKVRVRFINAAISASLRVFFKSAPELKIVEADGELVQPLALLRDTEIHAGQRYSVILDTSNITASTADVVIEVGATGERTVFRLVFENSRSRAPLSLEANFTEPVDNITLWRPLVNTPVPAATRTLILNIGRDNVTDTYSVNGKDFKLPNSSNLLEMAYRNPQSLSSIVNLYPLKIGEVVDIVLQSVGMCAIHPWHMHGHSFWDMGSGEGVYNSRNATLSSTPIKRDTTAFTPFEPRNGVCGWRLVRVKVEYAGIWHMHCHIHDHMVKGMQLALAVSPEQLRRRQE